MLFIIDMQKLDDVQVIHGHENEQIAKCNLTLLNCGGMLQVKKLEDALSKPIISY